MRVALKFAYNGKDFSGYARQPGQRTVEQTLLDVLMRHDFFRDPKDACFRTASRTDRGVSALGNVCAFDTKVSPDEIVNLLSSKVPSMFLYGMSEVEPGFYPRHANRREYRYYLRRHGLDLDKVLMIAGLFTGEHNFQNFARVEPLKTPIRVIDNILIEETQDFFVIDFFAQTFLWNQIRRIVSAVKKVGDGTLLPKDVKVALDHPEKRVDFQVAAPEPLLLKDVVYDFSFDYVKIYKKRLQDFEKSIVSNLG
jgi:tRNA pseudouridine38-40 synthase